MNKYSYYREILNSTTQFVAAFDDCFVYRYTKDFQRKEKIKVRYVFGPKNRVLYDIVNQAKNITIPAIAIEQTNIRRDTDRIQNKDQKLRRYHITKKGVSKIPTPIPVIMDLKISIIAKYKEDIDQIVSNILPWCNPYFVISMKIPEEFGLDFIDELRTVANWSGEVSFDNPTNINETEKYNIIGDTQFTLRGWIFPPYEEPVAPIYVVNTDFISVSSGAILDYNYNSLSAYNDTDVINISAYPEFTNLFYQGMIYDEDISISNQKDQTFTFYGKRFGFDNKWYLSGYNIQDIYPYTEIQTARYPTISAYEIPESNITVVNDNITVINFNRFELSAGNFTFVTSNSAGWGSTDYSVSILEV